MKNRLFFNWLIIFLGVVAMTSFCFTPAFAEIIGPNSTIQSEDDFMPEESGEDFEILDESFGEGYQMTWIPIESFTPNSHLTAWGTSSGYAEFTSLQSPYLSASINLPSGAYVVHARFYYLDNAAGHADCWIYRFEYPNSSTLLGSFSSSGTPGYNSYYIGLNHTIRNRNGAYSVYIGTNQPNTNQLQVGGVRIMWKRQISPAPSSATFNDVGTGHWAFQSVEALAAAGITQGCPDGPNLYCPDKPVSRAAMAAFLARALGLHWDSLEGY